MAKISKPKKGTKGTPPVPTQPTGNLETKPNTDAVKIVGLNFKVNEDVRKRFKQAALDKGLKLNEMLVYLLEQHEAK